MTTQNTQAQSAPKVSAGTHGKVTLKTRSGKVLVTKPFPGLKKDTTVVLDGEADLLDISAKPNVAAKLRLEDTPTAMQDVLFQGKEPWTQKKGGILICEQDGCQEVFARFTSDMHQATLCDRDRIKARRARQAAKRKAAKAAK